MKKIYISILFVVFGILNFHSAVIFAQSPVDTMIMHKSAEFNYETSSGVITLENYVTGEMKIAQEAKPIDAILVLDFSSSMLDSYSKHEDFTLVKADVRKKASDFGLAKYKTEPQTKTNQFSVSFNGTNHSVNILHVAEKITPSMAEPYWDNGRDWCYFEDGDKRYYVRPDGEIVEAKSTNDPTFSTFPQSTDGLPIAPVKGDNAMLYCTYTTETKSTTTRALALQKGVNRFIDLVSEHSTKSGVANRIAIAQFQASDPDKIYINPYSEGATKYVDKTALKTYLTEAYTDLKYDGSKSTWTTSDADFAGKSAVLKRFMDVSSTNAVNILKHSITDMQFLGQTPHNAGVAIAKELMKFSRSTDGGKNVAPYVIIFSDGEPVGKSSTTFDEPIANSACEFANDIKTTYPNAKIYTIYCNSETPSDKVKGFMQRMSSDYSGATKYNNGTYSGTTKYYKEVGDDLAKIFEDISQEIIIESSSKYDVNTTLNDFINNEYFQLPETATVDDIYVYENKCADYNKTTKEYKWARETGDSTRRLVSPEITITITKGNHSLPKTDPAYNDRISITGYDYGKNWCGMDISKTPNVAHGARTIVKIPFVYTTSTVWGDLPTNSDKSGVTVVDSTGKTVDDKKYNVPTLPFCFIKITRDSLHKGESAIYVVEKENSAGNWEFVDKVVIGGSGSGLDTCALYGVPGTRFKITETNWNWAYQKDSTSIIHAVDTTQKPYQLLYTFTGNHKVPTGSTHEKEKDPANLHNHDEAFKVNHLSLPQSPDLAPRPDAIEPKNGYELLPCPYFRE